MKASVKAFYDYCQNRGIKFDDRNFTMRYRADIPNRVGLAGSSALITACLRALMGFYNVTMPRHVLASVVLSVENTELDIPAGLEDRVAQAYQGRPTWIFPRDLIEGRGYGTDEPLDPGSLPPVYIAFRRRSWRGMKVYHNDLAAAGWRRMPR